MKLEICHNRYGETKHCKELRVKFSVHTGSSWDVYEVGMMKNYLHSGQELLQYFLFIKLSRESLLVAYLLVFYQYQYGH